MFEDSYYVSEQLEEEDQLEAFVDTFTRQDRKRSKKEEKRTRRGREKYQDE